MHTAAFTKDDLEHGKLKIYLCKHADGLVPGRHNVRVDLRDAFPGLSADESMLVVRSQMLVVEPKCPSGACPADLGVGSNARRGDETAHGEFPSGRTTDGNEGEKLWQGGACSAWRQVREVHLFHYRDPGWMKYYGVIENFGDYLGLAMMERLVGPIVSVSSSCPKPPRSRCAHARQLHTIGSIVHCASSDDMIWGSGQRSADILHVFGRDSQYAQLECFAVRGPRTRTGLQAKGCACPEVYGDPGLLFPFLFPEFQRPSQPTRAFLIVMHFTEPLIPDLEDHIIFNSEPWHDVIRCQSSCGVCLPRACAMGDQQKRRRGRTPLWWHNKHTRPRQLRHFSPSLKLQ
jgi:hypothetical protein